LETLAAEITAAGGTCVPVAMDMTDAASIAAGVAEAEAAPGKVTILINADIPTPSGPTG
jgi:NADP-dependent 3-hydroxy acid dehydrogenase YdfG